MNIYKIVKIPFAFYISDLAFIDREGLAYSESEFLSY